VCKALNEHCLLFVRHGIPRCISSTTITPSAAPRTEARSWAVDPPCSAVRCKMPQPSLTFRTEPNGSFGVADMPVRHAGRVDGTVALPRRWRNKMTKQRSRRRTAVREKTAAIASSFTASWREPAATNHGKRNLKNHRRKSRRLTRIDVTCDGR
jgi:hypothetical protein